MVRRKKTEDRQEIVFKSEMKVRMASWQGPPFLTISLSSPSGTWAVNIWGRKWTWDRMGKEVLGPHKQSWSNTYSFETSLRSHLVCFPGQAPCLQRREPCVLQKNERGIWQTGCLETLSRGIKWKSLKCPGSQREMSVGHIWCIGCQHVTSKSESKFLLKKKEKKVKELKVLK